MRELILAAVAQYGSPVLFAVVTIAAIGVPLPVTLLLLVTGSLVFQHLVNLWWSVGLAAAGSILGDQIGYAIGRWGGNTFIGKLTSWLGGPERLDQAQEKARRWGGPGIFFSRWLVGALGPWINLASGMASYPWGLFLFWDVLGEVAGAVLYIWLGLLFSDRVLALEDLLGDLSWGILALFAALLFGWKLIRLMWPFASRRRLD